MFLFGVRLHCRLSSALGGFFDSPAILYDSIRLLLAENSPSGRVKFIEHHSSLVCKLPLVAMPWTIPMERVEPKADVRNDLLENQVKQLSARVKFLEHLIRAPAKVEGPRFEDVSVPDFTLSADRKTASRHVGNGNGGWHGFLSKQSLAAMGNKFTVKLTPNGEDLSVGVALRNADPYDGFNNTEGCWMLQLGAGPSCCFCSNGNNGTEFSTQTEIVDGSRLSVRLDPLNKLLYFSINGSVLHIADIPEPFGDLYAAVDLQAAGQSVSFL